MRGSLLFKKRLQHRFFPVNFAKRIRKPFLKEHRWWLHLNHQLIAPQNKALAKESSRKYFILIWKKGCAWLNVAHTAQKKISIKDFFSKFDQMRRKIGIWWHLLKKSFIFCIMTGGYVSSIDTDLKRFIKYSKYC